MAARAVAGPQAVDPFGFVGARRGIVGKSIVVAAMLNLVLLYVVPIAASFLTPTVATTPFVSVQLPSFAFPPLRAPATATGNAAPGEQATNSEALQTAAAQTAVRHRAKRATHRRLLPVFENRYTTTAPTPSRAGSTDPLASMPTIETTIGGPVTGIEQVPQTTPDAPAAPAAATTTPPATADQTAPDATTTPADLSAAPDDPLMPIRASATMRTLADDNGAGISGGGTGDSSIGGGGTGSSTVTAPPADSSGGGGANNPTATPPTQTQVVVDDPVPPPPLPGTQSGTPVGPVTPAPVVPSSVPPLPVIPTPNTNPGAPTTPAPGLPSGSGAGSTSGAAAGSGGSAGSTGGAGTDTTTPPSDTGPGSSGSTDPNGSADTGGSGPRGPPLPTTITPDAGGVATSSDANASVTFAAGAVSSDTSVLVAVDGAASPPSSIVAVSPVYDLTAVDASGAQVHQFGAAPQLTIVYDPSSGQGLPSIYYLDPANGPQRIDSTVDAQNHTVTAYLPHFSNYVAAVATSDLSTGVPVVEATITGTVYAPDGTTPVAGVLVQASSDTGFTVQATTGA